MFRRSDVLSALGCRTPSGDRYYLDRGALLHWLGASCWPSSSKASAQNIPEQSNTITSIVHFIVLVVICGGLNAALIADFLTVGKGRFPSNFKFHRASKKHLTILHAFQTVAVFWHHTLACRVGGTPADASFILPAYLPLELDMRHESGSYPLASGRMQLIPLFVILSLIPKYGFAQYPVLSVEKEKFGTPLSKPEPRHRVTADPVTIFQNLLSPSEEGRRLASHQLGWDTKEAPATQEARLFAVNLDADPELEYILIASGSPPATTAVVFDKDSAGWWKVGEFSYWWHWDPNQAEQLIELREILSNGHKDVIVRTQNGGNGGAHAATWPVLVPEIQNPPDHGAALWVFELSPTPRGR